MVKTYGLSHISLSVRDLERSCAFYEGLLGARVVHREADGVQLQTPGCHDIIALEKREGAGAPGGVAHFGFRLVDAKDIDLAIEAAKRGGGTLLRRGEFAPGMPFAYVADPDGYAIEIWFE